ncbi:MAG: HEAT repeat domain-containing protein, partial [Planctomycetes bacterium]|nr:HEAT repeat domain-containing protein [Planctomycetota bacterium]
GFQQPEAKARHDRLLHDGKTDEAARIYDQLYVPDEPARLAALKGVLQTAGDRASDVVLSVLASGDAAAQQVAIQHVEQIGSAGIRSLAAGRSKLPLDAQIHLISALGIRGDAAGLPTVLAALDSDHHDVRLAALRALGGVGNASAVPRLVQVMQAGNDAGDAARESLETLSAEGVDAKLVEAMQQTDDAARRAQLIEILDRRRDADAVPALLQEILHRDASVRRRAMAALGRLAGEADVAGMIDGLVRVEDGGERDEAEKAITAVCNRIPDETRKGEVLLTIYNRASADDQSSILQVLGRLGGEKPLQTIRTAIADVDVQRHDSGVRAICNWPDSSVAEDLLKLAETDRDQANRVRALRALARVAVLPSERSEESKLQLLKDGMRLAGRDDERKLILDRAREARTVETARFAATFLDDPAVAERACRTIVEIAHRREIRGPHQEEFDKLLARVAQVTKDRGLADRARSYMTQK